jgi:hypothetical protein
VASAEEVDRKPPPDDRRCTAEQKAGGRCIGWAVKGGIGLCACHDVERRRSSQKKGAVRSGELRSGRAEAKRLRAYQIKLGRVEDIPATLELIADEVASEVMNWRVGSTLARIAQAAVTAHATIDELAERAHKRRLGVSDETLREALQELRAAQERQRGALS